MTAAPTLTPPAIGQVWPGQGGIYLGTRPGSATGQPVHIVAATRDVGQFTWGRYGEDTQGASSATDGAANTAALLREGDHPAAQACAEYSADGHADFYLPSRRELQLAAVVAPESFSTSGLYWSSTQDSRHGAFCQDFEFGCSDWRGKDDESRVRPFRGFILEPLGHLSPSTAEGGPAAIFSAAPSSLRDQFAGMAMLGHLITDTVPGPACDALIEAAQKAGRDPVAHLAFNAYEVADAMLAARATAAGAAS